MPEAVIVATARSPIGRAFKGSLKDLRPDDLTATIVRAALDKVPAARPAATSTTCCSAAACPAASRASTWPAWSPCCSATTTCPGATVTRYCSSSLQTTRMAFHAIKAGEGDVFVSAGVEMVSRFAKGSSDGLPDTHEPGCSDRRRRPAREKRAEAGAPPGTTPARTATLPDVYIAMGQTAENVAQLKGVTREEQDEFGVRSPEPRREGHRERLLGREITPVDAARTAPSSPRTTARGPASTLDEVSRPQAGLPARTARITAGNCCPLNDGAAAGRDHVRHEGSRARHHAARPDRLHRRHRPLPGDHGPRPGRGVPAGAEAGRA